MTREEAIKRLGEILTEAVEFENSVCYVTEEDREPLEMAIKALEQSYNSIKPELNGDMISRQAVCEIIEDIRDCVSVMGYWAFLERLKKLPAVNTTKTGHWIFVDKAHEHAHCSECDYGNVDLLDGRPHNYCPNCGCRMVEPQESEDTE